MVVTRSAAFDGFYRAQDRSRSAASLSSCAVDDALLFDDDDDADDDDDDDVEREVDDRDVCAR